MNKDQSLEMNAFIDSGADGSFIDADLVEQLGLSKEQLPEAIEATTLNGSSLARITMRTEPVKMLLSGNHSEFISFFILSSPHVPLVIGYPWLKEHNPSFDWVTGKVTSWSIDCHANCLRTACSPAISSQISDSVPPDLSLVPETYHELGEVFSKQKAQSLPPHRPYDCAINLFPGAAFPKGRLYSISRPEREALETYIKESLAASLIRPSSSPLGAGFFFVSKKDGSLRPCIDYRGLNDITVKNKYPLPLMSSAFDSLQGATVFTKLDLRNAYHLVRIKEGDEWLTGFNTPMGHFEYQVMPFGLTNAPAVFQSMVNDVLRDMIGIFVFVYLDDILIFSKELSSHVQHVKQVLQRLLENRLFVKAEKCDFHAHTTSFLGYIISRGELKMDQEKVRAVRDWVQPGSRLQLQ